MLKKMEPNAHAKMIRRSDSRVVIAVVRSPRFGPCRTVSPSSKEANSPISLYARSCLHCTDSEVHTAVNRISVLVFGGAVMI